MFFPDSSLVSVLSVISCDVARSSAADRFQDVHKERTNATVACLIFISLADR